MDNQPIQLTRDELKELMEEAVKEAFIKMGIDADEPIEMQKDFQHLREWRLSVASVRNKSILVLVGIVVSGLAGALWLGIKSGLGTGAP